MLCMYLFCITERIDLAGLLGLFPLNMCSGVYVVCVLGVLGYNLLCFFTLLLYVMSVPYAVWYM